VLQRIISFPQGPTFAKTEKDQQKKINKNQVGKEGSKQGPFSFFSLNNNPTKELVFLPPLQLGLTRVEECDRFGVQIRLDLRIDFRRDSVLRMLLSELDGGGQEVLWLDCPVHQRQPLSLLTTEPPGVKQAVTNHVRRHLALQQRRHPEPKGQGKLNL